MPVPSAVEGPVLNNVGSQTTIGYGATALVPRPILSYRRHPLAERARAAPRSQSLSSQKRPKKTAHPTNFVTLSMMLPAHLQHLCPLLRPHRRHRPARPLSRLFDELLDDLGAGLVVETVEFHRRARSISVRVAQEGVELRLRPDTPPLLQSG